MSQWVEVMGGKFKIKPISDEEEFLWLCHSAMAGGNQDVMRSQMSAAIEMLLEDWDEVLDAKGTPIPFSQEFALAVLEDEPGLMFRIVAEAGLMSSGGNLGQAGGGNCV